MSDPIQKNLNHIPHLSPFTAELKLTYDRKLKGVRFDVKGFKVGEEPLIEEILKQAFAIMSSQSFQDELRKANFEATVLKRGDY